MPDLQRISMDLSLLTEYPWSYKVSNFPEHSEVLVALFLSSDMSLKLNLTFDFLCVFGAQESLGNDHITWRGGYGFFPKKYSDSQCCWKKYSDFGGGKKNNLIESFCHIT
jgi:hypothetical protein